MSSTATNEALVTITNKRRRMKTFNLEGEHMRARSDFGYKRLARSETQLDPKSGIYRQKRGRHSAPSSLTFLARETKQNVPAAILQCPEVKAAWKERGDLKVIFQEGRIAGEKQDLTGRKTALQLQNEAAAATRKAESEHAKSELVKNAEAEHAKKTKKKAKRNGRGSAPSGPAAE